jgi:two-component system alkaline phosphatase synthesis response regulator PhoP
MDKKILLIDDDKEDLMLMEHYLKKAGFVNLSSVSSGEEAVEYVKKEKPFIIILDTILSGMDGFETCQALRTFCGEETKIIILTGNIGAVDVDKAKACGATECTVKGNNYLHLVGEVQKICLKLKQEEK